MGKKSVPQKVRASLLQALRAGLAPRIGQQHIQVGRKKEVQAILSDLARVQDGGSAFRLIIGDYGAGKTFFLNLVRNAALERAFVTASATLGQDKRLSGSSGTARNLYVELMRSISTNALITGDALSEILATFFEKSRSEAKQKSLPVAKVVESKLRMLSGYTNGYEFAELVATYCRAHEEGKQQLKSNALRAFRGEFSTKAQARSALGISFFIDDSTYYPQLKLFAAFVRLSGYSGLVVLLDEMLSIYKLASPQVRAANYEALLQIMNDSLQGTPAGLGFVMAGIPDLLFDTRRGIYSHEPLKRRLTRNAFAGAKFPDLGGAVLELPGLTNEEFLLLLDKIRLLQAGGKEFKALVPRQAIQVFLEQHYGRLGASQFLTPGKVITSFIDLLAVLDQNKQASWQELLGNLKLEQPSGGLKELEGFVEVEAEAHLQSV